MATLLVTLTLLAAVFAAVQGRARPALTWVMVAAVGVAVNVASQDLLVGVAIVLCQATLLPLAAMHLRRLEDTGTRSLSVVALGAGTVLGLVLILMPRTPPVVASDDVVMTEPVGLAILVAATALPIGAAVAVRLLDGRQT